jgi:hypothetical protein
VPCGWRRTNRCFAPSASGAQRHEFFHLKQHRGRGDPYPGTNAVGNGGTTARDGGSLCSKFANGVGGTPMTLRLDYFDEKLHLDPLEFLIPFNSSELKVAWEFNRSRVRCLWMQNSNKSASIYRGFAPRS